LVTTVVSWLFEVWEAPLDSDPESNGRAARRLLDDSYGGLWIHSAGPGMLFNSWLTGSRNLWLMPLDGSGAPRQMTSFAENSVTHAALSPDGRQVAYTSLQTGNAEIFTMNVDGSSTTQLTRTVSSEFWPAWTHDGQWISFASEGQGRPQIWRMPASGGEPVQLTKNGGIRGDWSPVDNRFVHVVGGPARKPSLEVVDFDGDVLLSVEWPDALRTLPVWSPDGRRFSATKAESPDNDSVWVFDATTGEGTPAVRFPGRFRLSFRVLWTPDGRSVVVNPLEQISHVVLLENFW
jgi:Tol biopolymer transport system component